MDALATQFAATQLPGLTPTFGWIFGLEPGLQLAIPLLALGLILVVAEVFIPSGGTLSIGAVFAVGGSVVSAFQAGVLTGFVFLAAVIILVPIVLAVSFRFFPNTPIGRLMMPPPPDAAAVSGSGVGGAADESLVGQTGVVSSELRPSGKADIAGELRTVINESGNLVEEGRRVQVVEVKGNRIVVRAIS